MPLRFCLCFVSPKNPPSIVALALFVSLEESFYCCWTTRTCCITERSRKVLKGTLITLDSLFHSNARQFAFTTSFISTGNDTENFHLTFNGNGTLERSENQLELKLISYHFLFFASISPNIRHSSSFS
jgi:hypothetical protein